MLLNRTMEMFRTTIRNWLEDPGVDEFQGLNMRKLGMDEAYVVTNTNFDYLNLYSVSDDCYNCAHELLKPINIENSSEVLVVNTEFPVTWDVVMYHSKKYLVTSNITGIVCNLRPDMGEFGVYALNVTQEGCDFSTLKPPVNIYAPLFMAVIFLFNLWFWYANVIVACSNWRHQRGKPKHGEEEASAKQRVLSLDIFRGISVVSMIFINVGGGGYKQWIGHATWNGLNFADLIAPCFVWIMGFCIPLTVKGFFNRGVPKSKALQHILKRSAALFVAGVSISSTPYCKGFISFNTFHVMGTLQRLGLSYCVGASIYLLTTRKHFTEPRSACGKALRDVWAVIWCWLAAALVLALHTFLTFRVHHPACPAGYLGPEKLHNNMAEDYICRGGAAGYIDRLILTEGRLYMGKLHSENIMATLTTIVQVFIGIQAGATLLHFKSHQARTARWLAWALVLAIVGASLAGFSKEKGLIPINRTLWSISFVMVTSAFSSVLLTATYALSDIRRIWGGRLFLAPGRNALFLYCAHILFYNILPAMWMLDGQRTHAKLLLENVWCVCFWTVVSHIMAKKNIYITI